MKTIEIDCWEVTEPDGCGVRSNHVAYFSDKNVAYQYIASKGKNGWVDREPTHFRKSYTIFESISEMEMKTKQNAVAAAKAKLTPEELRLLGIE